MNGPEHSAEKDDAGLTEESARLLAVYRAIATVEDSRRTHAEWLAHWQRMEAEGHSDCATCIETAKVAGGREHQERCIADYDNVLAVLSTCVTPLGSGDAS